MSGVSFKLTLPGSQNICHWLLIDKSLLRNYVHFYMNVSVSLHFKKKAFYRVMGVAQELRVKYLSPVPSIHMGQLTTF